MSDSETLFLYLQAVPPSFCTREMHRRRPRAAQLIQTRSAEPASPGPGHQSGPTSKYTRWLAECDVTPGAWWSVTSTERSGGRPAEPSRRRCRKLMCIPWAVNIVDGAQKQAWLDSIGVRTGWGKRGGHAPLAFWPKNEH